jgi:hypothetical protein
MLGAGRKADLYLIRRENEKMNKKIGWVIGTLVVVLLAAGMFGATTALADDNGPGRPLGDRGAVPGERGNGGRGLDGAALEAVAGVLNMSTEDLSAALQSGKTLQELTDQAGVDMQAVRDALGALRTESMRERISQGLADGSLTKDHADWLLEGLDKGYLDGPGFGFGGRADKASRSIPAE